MLLWFCLSRDLDAYHSLIPSVRPSDGHDSELNAPRSSLPWKRRVPTAKLVKPDALTYAPLRCFCSFLYRPGVGQAHGSCPHLGDMLELVGPRASRRTLSAERVARAHVPSLLNPEEQPGSVKTVFASLAEYIPLCPPSRLGNEVRPRLHEHIVRGGDRAGSLSPSSVRGSTRSQP